MKFRAAIGLYIKDSQSLGRINSPNTVRIYVSRLNVLAEQVGNRDPRTVGRNDVKRTLQQWGPSSQAHARSIYISFFDWCEQEGHIDHANPARKTSPPRVNKASRYRLTLEETLAVVAAADDTRERRAIYLTTFAGLRNAELRALMGLHFQRPGYIWISREIGKGSRERWIPVLTELVAVADEIVADVAVDEYVLPARRWADAPVNSRQQAMRKRPSSSQALGYLIRKVMQRAGIAAAFDPDSKVGAHTLRHAFTDYVARTTGDVRIVQALLGHASIATTQGYLGQPTLDELTAALSDRLPPATPPFLPDHDKNGRERSVTSGLVLEPILERWLRTVEPSVRLYEEAFR